MSGLANQLESSDYIKAVKATDGIESPALGFVKPSDYKSTLESQKALIKQNNTLISICLNISERLQNLEEQVQGLKRFLAAEKQPISKELEQSVEELTKKIGGLSLGQDTNTIPKKKGSILVYRNPSDILAQEKKK